MDAVYVKNMSKKDKDKLREQQKTLKEAMVILDIDEMPFYNLVKKGPDPVCNYFQLQQGFFVLIHVHTIVHDRFMNIPGKCKWPLSQ